MKHLVRRQRHRVEEEEETEVVFVTLPNTFAATRKVALVTVTEDVPKSAVGGAFQQTKTLGEPAVRPLPTSSRDKDEEEEEEEEQEQSTKPTPTPTRNKESHSSEATSHPITTHAQSTLKIDTSSSPVVTLSSFTGAIAAASISSTAPSATSSAEAASSGMSGGAKAGLALGILVGIGALLGAILFVAHRKKKERAEAQQQMDNEKATSMRNMPPPPVVKEATPSIRSQPNAPRLSLRPVTQFDPAFPNRKSDAGLLGAAAAGAGAAAAGAGSRSPDRPGSSWERPGASNANVAPEPANPFNDPQSRSDSPPQNPFSNNAAIETSQASAPGTPLNFNHSPAPSADFGNPAPAIAAAEKAPVAAPLPSPPVINLGNVPASPAWTEDIPASPGPAPSGPLPVAAAAGVAAAGAAGAPPAPNNVHRVQLDFKPSMADELELHAGQLVRMLHEYDDGWALCVRLDRSHQGVVPRTCLSKHPVKPRQGPPRQGPPGPPRMRSPPVNGPNKPQAIHTGVPQPRPLSPANNGRSSPHPPSLSPAHGRMSPAPRSMSPGPRQMSPGPHQMGPPQGRARAHSNAPYASKPRSMSPGPYGGGPQMAPPPQMGRPRSNSASQVARRGPPAGPSPMNPNTPMPIRKPIPGQAL